MDKNKYEQEAQSIDNDTPDVEFTDVTPGDGDSATVEDDVLESEDENEEEALKDQLDKALKANESMKKDYMFLMAEFDNFKKRTLKEKREMLKNAAESTLKGLL
ncbi:MAG: nucleotide exchange factor GrpE, partial [Muribaculaceae bacterium]|nr:nucleotide exchange factor GrpE [Muribaculaceae bacterium]